MRFVNNGTAPISKFKPNLNIGIQESSNAKINTVTSIYPAENRIVQRLDPASFYPSLNQGGLNIEKSDDFNSSKITLTKTQLEQLTMKNHKLVVSNSQLTLQIHKIHQIMHRLWYSLTQKDPQKIIILLRKIKIF